METQPRRTKANPVPLRELLNDIEAGRVALPDFQRDFDWVEKDVTELLVTVLSGWPAGSLLFVAGRPDYLPPRAFQDGPTPGPRISHMVLDGQQRLTALFHALGNHGPKVYWLDVSNLHDLTVDDLEERVSFDDREAWSKDSPRAAEQYVQGKLPMYVLTSAADFFDWRDDVLESLSADAAAHARQDLTHLYRSLLSNVSSYEFPVVEIPATVEAAAIARIFERVNKTGMTLGPFDLMVARTYKRDWNLRSLWEIAITEHPLLRRFFEDDGLPVLRAIALRAHQNVRRGAVLEMAAQEVHGLWEPAIDATQKALSYLVRKCGVVDRDFLPYQASLVLLAGLALDYDLDEHDEILQRWFWGVSFAAAYDVASNTKVVADYSGLQNAIGGTGMYSPPPINGTEILRTTRRKRSIWRAFHCALAKNGARDILGDTLGFEAMADDPESSPPQPAWISLADRETGLHLHALTRVACTRSTYRQLRSGSLSQRQVLPEAAASQFMNSGEMEAGIDLMLTRMELLDQFVAGFGLPGFERDADLDLQSILQP